MASQSQTSDYSHMADYEHILKELLKSGAASDPKTAATSFATPTERAFAAGEVSYDGGQFNVWQPWSYMAHLIRQFKSDDGAQQEKLVAFTADIKARGEVKGPNGSVLETPLGVAWKDLPGLGASFREVWNDSPPRMPGHEWARLNEFVARLSASEAYDFSLYGIWELRDCLEQKQAVSEREVAGNKLKTSMEELLPATVQWLEHFGTQMRQLCTQQKGYKDPEHSNDPGALGGLAKEAGLTQTGYNLPRWEFWKSRLHEISEAKDDAGGRENSAKIAHQALQYMNEIDSKA